MAATRPPRNRAKEFEAFSRSRGPADLDPEADNDAIDLSGSDDDVDDDEEFGTEEDAARGHYVDVGKSSLREKARRAGEVPLGPRYVGKRVERAGLDEDDEDEDGFVEGSGGESESEEGIEGLESGLEDDDEEEGESDEDDDMNAFDEDDEESDEADDFEDNRPRPTSDVGQNKKAQLRDVMREERSVAIALSKATQADAEKGRAVKKQRATFDSLLGSRIKLQKSLVGVNTLVELDREPFDAEMDDAVKSAEDAAFKFWTALNDFREGMISSRTGEKRKRASFSASTSSQALWNHIKDQEEASLPHRNSILRKWSAKTGQATSLPRDSGLRANHQSATIIDMLQQHLADSERLLKRARTVRSCAPLQVSRQLSEDARIYDDADFYGQLLKELLEQKSSSADAAPAAVDLDFKAVKTKRNVDTKASKGRKLRYTVHEKLQNFMAPEDRGTWGERQADELFGSLFGRRMALGDEDADDGVEYAEANREAQDGSEEADNADFMMFRS